MEARQAFEGASISKTFVAIVLILVALSLGVMGAYVAKSLTGSAAAPATQSVQFTPNKDLRQDNDYPVRTQRAHPITQS